MTRRSFEIGRAVALAAFALMALSAARSRAQSSALPQPPHSAPAPNCERTPNLCVIRDVVAENAGAAAPALKGGVALYDLKTDPDPGGVGGAAKATAGMSSLIGASVEGLHAVLPAEAAKATAQSAKAVGTFFGAAGEVATFAVGTSDAYDKFQKGDYVGSATAASQAVAGAASNALPGCGGRGSLCANAAISVGNVIVEDRLKDPDVGPPRVRTSGVSQDFQDLRNAAQAMSDKDEIDRQRARLRERQAASLAAQTAGSQPSSGQDILAQISAASSIAASSAHDRTNAMVGGSGHVFDQVDRSANAREARQVADTDRIYSYAAGEVVRLQSFVDEERRADARAASAAEGRAKSGHGVCKNDDLVGYTVMGDMPVCRSDLEARGQKVVETQDGAGQVNHHIEKK